MQQAVNASSSLYLTNYTELIASTAELITSITELLISLIWPIFILIIFLYIFYSKKGYQYLINLLKSFKSIKMFGTEFVLSEKLSEEVGVDAEKAFELYRKQTKREYNRFVEIYGLRQKVENVIESNKVSKALDNEDKKKITEIPDFRCTIHVPDILFRETLYQLIDYYPGGGGRGRTWSVRFGIIGRVWRSGNSETQGNVPKDREKLISRWGMTKEEALKFGQGRRSFACVVLKHNESETAVGIPVGIFYLDSTKENAFGSDEENFPKLHQAILEESKNCGLTNDLDKLRKELLNRSPLIKIYG